MKKEYVQIPVEVAKTWLGKQNWSGQDAELRQLFKQVLPETNCDRFGLPWTRDIASNGDLIIRSRAYGVLVDEPSIPKAYVNLISAAPKLANLVDQMSHFLDEDYQKGEDLADEAESLLRSIGWEQE